MNNYYHKSLFNLKIDKSQIPDAGLGVYTLEPIPKDTLIDEYFGQLFTYPIGGSYILQIDDRHCIDAINYPRCYMAMINDCSFIPKKTKKKKGKKINITPKEYYGENNQILEINCIFKIDSINKKGYIYSLVDIDSGSELFISYGHDYWN